MRAGRTRVGVLGAVVAAVLVPLGAGAAPAGAVSSASGVAAASMSEQIDFCAGQRYCTPNGPVTQGPLTFLGDVPAGPVTADHLTIGSWSAVMSGSLVAIPTVSFTGTGTQLESLAGTCSGVFALNGYTVAGVAAPIPEPEFAEYFTCSGVTGTTAVSFELDLQGVQIGSEYLATEVSTVTPPPVPLGTGTAAGTSGPVAESFALEGTMPFLPAGTLAQSYVTCPVSSSSCSFTTFPQVGIGSLDFAQGSCQISSVSVPPALFDLGCTGTSGSGQAVSFTAAVLAVPTALDVPDGAYVAT